MSQAKRHSRSPKKSSIFSRKASTAVSIDSSAVRIFYFGHPLSKNIKFEKKTTTKDLIQMALDAYASESHFDQSKIISMKPDMYELRFQSDEKDWIPNY